MTKRALALALVGLAGCTWVAVTPEGEGVRLASQTEMGACERLGKTTSKTSDRIVFARGDKEIRQELEALARNEAAGMGGNAIVPQGVPEEGRQTFDVYRCP